jgi:hypothetical protein
VTRCGGQNVRHRLAAAVRCADKLSAGRHIDPAMLLVGASGMTAPAVDRSCLAKAALKMRR